MPYTAPSYYPSGDISPARFVKFAGPGFTVSQASSQTDRLAGISHEGSQYPPGLFNLDSLAARTGAPSIRVFGRDEPCFLTIGGSGCTTGDWLKSDALGQGIPLASGDTGQLVLGAQALEPAASGAKCKVLPLLSLLKL